MSALPAHRPAAHGPPSSDLASISTTPCANRRLAHVLIVDDNEINLRICKSLCELLGFTSEFARDGLEAVDAVRIGNFDLVLMDVCMPNMDGVEATLTIRSMPGVRAEVPIIAVTANAEPGEIKTYLRAGMRAVVEKPIRVSRLFEAIGDVFEVQHEP
jgi:CheY-like chemotaxis protein